MQRPNFKVLGWVALVIDAALLLGTVATYAYLEVLSIGSTGLVTKNITHPYGQYSGFLLLAGAILLVLGLASLRRSQQEETM